MRRVLAILLAMLLLIGSLSVPTFAKEVGNYTVNLFYYNADKSYKYSFVSHTVYLDEALEPFQGQIQITLPEEIEPGDFFDIELSYTATEGYYTVDLIELWTDGRLYVDTEFGFAEMDSTHVSIGNLGVDDDAYGPVKYINIYYSVSSPEYDETTTVINGTPTKQYGFMLSVSDVDVSGIGELGFFSRILFSIVSLPVLLVQGVRNLFLPDLEAALSFRDKVDALLADRLGAAYEANDIIEDFAYSFGSGSSVATLGENSKPATISLPALTVNLAGSDFTFGGWEVQIIPDGFQDIVAILKQVVNMVCTLAFLNALKSRWEGFFH